MVETMFPRVYEIKNKFRYKIHADSAKIKVRRELFPCVVETFSGFQMVRSMLQNKLRVEYKPIDIDLILQSIISKILIAISL